MAESKVRTPDGRIINVRHPDNATPEQILAYAKSRSSFDSLLPSAPLPPPKPGAMDSLKGAGEAVLSLATSMPAAMASMPVAGVAAIGDIGLRKAAGLSEPSPTAEIVDKYTLQGYQPRTEEGKRMLGTATAPFRWLDEFFTKGGGVTQDALLKAGVETGRELKGYPELTAALATGVKFAPDVMAGILGARVPRSVSARRADVRGAEREAASMGLDLRAPTETQFDQLQQFGEQRFQPGITGVEGLEGIPDALARERGVQSSRIGSQIREAEGMGAAVPSRTAGNLAESLRGSVSSFAVDSMPSVKKLLDRADKFGLATRSTIEESLGVRNAAKTPVSDIFNFRESINANLPSDRRSPEYSALTRMKREVDNYLNDSMVNDLVSGNPTAITKYQDAITQWADFKTLFDGDRIMKKLQDDQATPEQIKSLILGMNAIKAPKQAANVVSKLEAVLGPRSPEYKAIQNSVLTDLMMPVLDVEPNWRKFVSNVDQFRKRNPTLGNELFDQTTMRELVKLRNFASGIEKSAPMDVRIKNAGFERIAAVLAAGNQLSRSAMRVSLVTRIFGALKPNMGESRKSQIIADVIGYDPRQSLFTTQPIKNIGALESLMQEEQ